jgi:hypothetical protein
MNLQSYLLQQDWLEAAGRHGGLDLQMQRLRIVVQSGLAWKISLSRCITGQCRRQPRIDALCRSV